MRVLFFVHGHPEFIRGGAEQASLELFEAMREHEGVEPILVARTSDRAFQRPGTPFGVVDGTDDQILLFTQWAPDDHFLQTASAKALYTRDLANLLRDLKPDLVHFQHTIHIGLEAVRLVRTMFEELPIVYTLHEYLPICHASGQMVRTNGYELCTHASPQRCHECFPDITPGKFLIRERFIKAQLDLVDRFIAPSRFLLERYVEWGIPREKLIELDYGRHPIEAVPPRKLAPGKKRSRFGYFGQLNPFKGVKELLEAMILLDEEGRRDITLHLSGANLEVQPKPIRKRLRKLIDTSPDSVRFLGRYDPRSLAQRMAQVDWVVVPSIWWENSPLVIQEAFMHGRPVLASDIGGMAERVGDGVNGLHFAVGEPDDIARALAEAADTEGLWERLRSGIPTVLPSAVAAARHLKIYDELRSDRGPRLTEAVPAQAGR
jgi:glycosyltransferase involved in cell wall biosynthesis